MTIPELLDLHELAIREAGEFPRRRFLFDQLSLEAGRHFIGIVGPRGAGKSVLLRQLAASRADAIYVSLDTATPETDLFDRIRTLRDRYGYRTFLLDEVHHLPEADRLLKQVYDFLDVRIVFTSSVALALRQSAHDLSRRAQLLTLFPFSYREYLTIARDETLPRLNLTELRDATWQHDHVRGGRHFDDYLRGASMPFALEEPDVLPLLENVLDAIISRDIPRVARLAIDELDTITKMVRFVGRSSVDGISYSSLSRNLGITKYKAEQYVGLLEMAFVLQRVFPAGSSVTREPKVLMSLPYRLLYREYGDAVGGLREDFFAEAMRQVGQSFAYLKSTRGSKTPDFLVQHDGEKLAIEIGGRGKGRRRFKGVTVDRKLILTHDDRIDEHRRPLFMLGYLA